jgi:transcriptional regulator with XRE-family HTH domain
MTILREIRRRKRLPIVELAFYSGMDDGAFSKAERGYKPFRKEAREKIAQHLEVKPADLFDERGYAKREETKISN